MPPFPCSYPSPLLALAALALLTGCPAESDDTITTAASQPTLTAGPAGPPGPITAPHDPTESAQTGTTSATPTSTTSDHTTTANFTTTTSDTSTTTSHTTGDTTGSVEAGKMSKWGHACTDDGDCKALIGDEGVCHPDILGLYELPGGYCTQYCQLSLDESYVEDHPICGPGVTCIGAMGYFEACTVECTDDSECPREGYECRLMPEIGQLGDPMFCLMTDDHKL